MDALSSKQKTDEPDKSDTLRPEELACNAISRLDFAEFKRIVLSGVDLEWNDRCLCRAAVRSADPLFMAFLLHLGSKSIVPGEIVNAVAREAARRGHSEEQLALHAQLIREGRQLAWLAEYEAREKAEGIIPSPCIPPAEDE